MPTPKGISSQNDHTTKSNFMTPTMSSAKKANHNQISTPTSASIEKAVTGKWMTSAVRRVGLRRVDGDGTPRSKKEGSKQVHNALTFPDKLSTSSQGPMPGNSSPKIPASLLSHKPLPSPPIAQIKSDHIEEPRSLIDASEKPLQRTSPKSPQKKEEWPVLFPQKPTTPDSLRQMLEQPSNEPAWAISGNQERYPLLRGPEVNPPDPQKPTSKLSSTYRLERKETSSSNLREKVVGPGSTEGRGRGGDRAINQTLDKKEIPQADPKVTHRLSAGAAAVEKSSSEAKSIKEPRQTRTSSLRARISAGQVIRDSPNKVLGFTDFTAEKGPLKKASNEDLGSGGGFQARSSSSFSKAFTKKSSRDSLSGSRAPAQIVAGSRRPSTRRPSSRNSLRGDSRAPSPAFLEPSRPAPPIPATKTKGGMRKSSIPISRNSITSTTAKAESGASSNDAAISVGVIGYEIGVNKGSGVIEDGPATAREGQDPDAHAGEQYEPNPVLESIAESPRSTFRSKRLSANTSSLEHGPTLKISSSANRIIMGTGESDKEKLPLAKKKSKDLFRAAVTNEHRNVSKGRTISFGPTKITNRPLSSQGFPENRPHSDSLGKAPKVKKVKSADLSVIALTPKKELEPIVNQAEGSKNSTETTALEDPFSNAERDGQSSGALEKRNGNNATAEVSSAAPLISPMKDSVTPSSDAIPVIPTFLPETIQEHVSKSNGASEPIRVDEVKVRKLDDSPLTINTQSRAILDQEAPSTPQNGIRTNGSPSSDIFPPRSSSRMKHPDYTISGSSKSSSVSPIDRVAVQLQKEISATQPGKAGITQGGNPLQLSSTDSEASRHEIASQTILADVGRKRDSIAHESNKSQASISKGLISNFRGLFHKRASDSTEASVARSTKKGGKRPTVTAHGSPFPSMSNIHPIHRPTQASMNRSSAASQRPGSHGLVVNSPGSPIASPLPSDVSTTTTLAMQILDSVRRESSSPKKERLLELGKLMVDTITQARDAEKAMEEAKQAARKAEVAHALCKKSVSDVANLVREWKGDVYRL